MVAAYHLIWAIYGYWLLNDPRGRSSRVIRSDISWTVVIGAINAARQSTSSVNGRVRIGPKGRRQFLDQLGVNSNGLGGQTNVNANIGTFSREPVPTLRKLTLRLFPEK